MRWAARSVSDTEDGYIPEHQHCPTASPIILFAIPFLQFALTTMPDYNGGNVKKSFILHVIQIEKFVCPHVDKIVAIVVLCSVPEIRADQLSTQRGSIVGLFFSRQAVGVYKTAQTHVNNFA